MDRDSVTAMENVVGDARASAADKSLTFHQQGDRSIRIGTNGNLLPDNRNIPVAHFTSFGASAMNRILTTMLTCLALTGAAWADDPAPRYTAKQFYETTAVGGASFSADESRILFSSDATGIFNVYSVPVAGGKAKQLTDSKQDAFRAI